MKTKFLGLFAVAVFAVAMASTASAAPACDLGVSNVVGSTCTEGTLTFSNFATSFSAGFSNTSPYTSTIGIGNGTVGTGVVGGDVNLVFQIAPEGPGAPANGDALMFYSVAGGSSGIDLSLGATPTFSGGVVAVTETACSTAFVGTTCTGTVLATYSVCSPTLGSCSAVNSDSAPFVGTYGSTVYIKKDIDFLGAATSEITNSSMTGVPEPMTLSLMGVGLLGLGLLGRRLRK